MFGTKMDTEKMITPYKEDEWDDYYCEECRYVELEEEGGE